MGVRRLFIGIYPPPEVARELLRQARAHAGDRARYTPVDQVHLTVHFLGDTDDRDLPDVQESILRSLAGLETFSLEPRRIIALPEQGAPRLLAAELPCPAHLAEAHRRLVTRLARPGAARRQQFLPHLTLCRYGPAGGPRIAADLHRAESLAFGVREVILMESVLMPSGARHSPLRAFALAP